MAGSFRLVGHCLKSPFIISDTYGADLFWENKKKDVQPEPTSSNAAGGGVAITQNALPDSPQKAPENCRYTSLEHFMIKMTF